jgi:hypothetical protein
MHARAAFLRRYELFERSNLSTSDARSRAMSCVARLPVVMMLVLVMCVGVGIVAGYGVLMIRCAAVKQ